MSPRSQRGLSLVEALIALGVMSAVAIFSLPPLMTALAAVNRGAEAAETVTLVSSEAELLARLPSDLDPLAVAEGLTSSDSTWYWIVGGDRWLSALPEDAILRWTLKISVTQHSLADLVPDGNGLSELDTPLAGGSAANFVQLQLIDFEITGARISGPLGAGQTHRYRLIKEA